MADIRDIGSAGNRTQKGSRHMYSVGEVCAMLGITRKTLFYYDRIGLAAPSDRIGSQAYKVYDNDALERLKKIVSCRNAGLTIEEIRALFTSDKKETERVYEKALDRLMNQRNELEEKIKRIRTLLEENRS